MKILPLVFRVLASPAFGQWIVNDPLNTAVNTAMQGAQAANHVEVLRQWAQQIEGINRQIRQLEDQLSEQRRIREVLGNPTIAGAQMVLDKLTPEDFSRTYGETLRAVQRLAEAGASLKRTAEGIYGPLDERTSLGQTFARRIDSYRRFAAVDQQADNTTRVFEDTQARQAALQGELGNSVAALKSAATQAEVDKLTAKIETLNGQLAVVAAQRRDEADKLQALQIQNENQAAKERQDFLEKQLVEEQQSLGVVNSWQRGLRLTPETYGRP